MVLLCTVSCVVTRSFGHIGHHCLRNLKRKANEHTNNPNNPAAGISGSVCVNHLWPVVAGGGGMTKDEALKLALEALEREEYRLRQTGQSQVYSGIGFAITAIKQALAAQPAVQEPIGYVKLIDTPFGEKLKPVLTIAVPVGSKLYTTPPAAQRQWVGLTDEEIKGSDWVLSAVKEYEAYTLQEELVIEGVAEFAHAIEAKLKEKNNG
jgi:hypothetical protein